MRSTTLGPKTTDPYIIDPPLVISQIAKPKAIVSIECCVTLLAIS
tara:strand:+ start:497 stop:631 length:135 start_codon:yes stop_codon:yes gene_type:complete